MKIYEDKTDFVMDKLKRLAEELLAQADIICEEHGNLVNHENFVQALDSAEETVKAVAYDLIEIASGNFNVCHD